MNLKSQRLRKILKRLSEYANGWDTYLRSIRNDSLINDIEIGFLTASRAVKIVDLAFMTTSQVALLILRQFAQDFCLTWLVAKDSLSAPNIYEDCGYFSESSSRDNNSSSDSIRAT